MKKNKENPLITVCIPAFRSGLLIQRTLRSVMRQHFSNFIVHVAIEPPAQNTYMWVEPFLSDPRMTISMNERRLGWDANIRQMLQKVETPYFIILPHDDFIHSKYLSTLLAEFSQHPDAVVVYSDMYVFGNGVKFVKQVDLPKFGSKSQQILTFFESGAEAVPWRGLTRTEVFKSTGDFPVDQYMGFLVECEWALQLICAGRAVRVAQPYYFKQLYPIEFISASKARILHQTYDQISSALDRHEITMFNMIEKSIPKEDKLFNKITTLADKALSERRKQLLTFSI